MTEKVHATDWARVSQAEGHPCKGCGLLEELKVGLRVKRMAELAGPYGLS